MIPGLLWLAFIMLSNSLVINFVISELTTEANN